MQVREAMNSKYPFANYTEDEDERIILKRNVDSVIPVLKDRSMNM
jgi:hypothetical protein